MTLDFLNKYGIEELDAVLIRAKELRDDLWAKKQAKARADAIAALEAVGLKPEDLVEPKARKAKKAVKPAFVPKAGHLYERNGHPNVTAKGTGVRPDWWHEDIAAGRLPLDLGPAKPEVIAERKTA